MSEREVKELGNVDSCYKGTTCYKDSPEFHCHEKCHTIKKVEIPSAG